MSNDFDAQHYCSLYCKYDPDGNRNWTELLQQNAVETIDLLIAKNALKAQEEEVEVHQIIYYGSPLAQQLTEENRVSYSFQITAMALFPQLIKVHFFDDGFNAKIPEPKYHLGQPVLVQNGGDSEYIITGITLDYNGNLEPTWAYCIGDEQDSHLDYDFEGSWHIEKDISLKEELPQNLPLFQGYYYILVSEDNHYWNGIYWTTRQSESKPYQSWKQAKIAQTELEFNPHFSVKKSEIKAIFKP